MKLFMCARWGNHLTGPDAEDTVFLVEAPDLRAAVTLVDSVLQSLSPNEVPGIANTVQELGESSSDHPESRVLLGPCIVSNALPYPGFTLWVRDWKDDDWMTFEEMHPELS